MTGSQIEDKFARVWKVYPLWNLNDWSYEIVPPFEHACGIRWNDMNTIDVAVNSSDYARVSVCNYEEDVPLISWNIKNKKWDLNGWDDKNAHTIGSRVFDKNFFISDSISHNGKSELFWSGKGKIYPEYNASLYYLDEYSITIKSKNPTLKGQVLVTP